MNQRDDELDKILKPLQEVSPNDFQMQSWQQSVQKSLNKGRGQYSKPRVAWALRLMAALFVGFVIGAVFFKQQQPEGILPTVAQNSFDDATFERSHANLD